MRIATISQRLCLIAGGGAIDVQAASDGQFSADPAAVYPRWAEFRDWAASARLPEPAPFEAGSLGAPSPSPRQVFGIGLNYCRSRGESGLRAARYRASGVHEVPVVHHRPAGRDHPAAGRPHRLGSRAGRRDRADGSAGARGRGLGATLPACRSARTCPSASCRWRRSHRSSAWASRIPGFGPVGPWLVTPDEFADPDDLELGCAINGEDMQKATHPGHDLRRP